nr:MAG TPA: hypothetical protein [Caudoviricetes sp.]
MGLRRRRRNLIVRTNTQRKQTRWVFFLSIGTDTLLKQLL